MNVPKLRFKEFTDEWTEYKYKDIFKLNQGLQIPIAKRFPTYAPNRFFYITNEFLKPSSKKSYYIENPSPNVICTKEDILMTRTGNTGKVITNIAGVFHNNFFRIKYNPKKFNKDFICCILNQNKIQNKILTLAGSSTIPDLNHKDFYSIKSKFPKLTEQEKIAKFINTIDKKISNLEDIITNLEKQKKGLLQQIFNQEIRFKDENGNNYPDWEEKLFSDTFSFLSTNSYSRTDMNEVQGTVKNIHYGDVLIKFNHIIDLSKHQLPYLIDYNSIPEDILKEQLKKQLIKNGDIVIADTAEDYTAGKVCEVINVNDNLVVSGLHTMLCRPKPDLFSLGFLGYFMNSYTYHHQLLRLITGTKVCSIIKKEIIKTKILIPCLEEQTKIADFLSAFDRKIDNQKAQLEHWKQIKKGLLQQMFV